VHFCSPDNAYREIALETTSVCYNFEFVWNRPHTCFLVHCCVTCSNHVLLLYSVLLALFASFYILGLNQ